MRVQASRCGPPALVPLTLTTILISGKLLNSAMSPGRLLSQRTDAHARIWKAVGWMEMTGGHTQTAPGCPGVLWPALHSWFTGSVHGATSKPEDVHKRVTSNFCFKILKKTGLPFQELSHGARAYQLVKSPSIAYCTPAIWQTPSYTSGPGSSDTQ